MMKLDPTERSSLAGGEDDLSMTNKERVHAALAGESGDRMPVAVLYHPLYQQDHFAELSGRPQWQLHQWLREEPEEHVPLYLEMARKTPFDILEPQVALPRRVREETEFVEREGRIFRHDKRNDTFTGVPPPVSGHATDQRPHQVQRVFSKADVDECVEVTRAEEMIERGDNDYLGALVEAAGGDEFILSGGVIGTLYSCSQYVGMSNIYPMLVEKPGLVEHLSSKILEQNIEQIRRLAAAGGDAIFIDDATATSDMISVEHYERFCLPYVREMVREIRRLGHRSVLLYFGGIADRLEQIASTGADALAMETSMKGYRNEIEEIAAAIGDRMVLFGNIDPVGVLEKGDEEGLATEICRQVAAGRKARGFVICTGSPITPGTPLPRVQRFIALARERGACG
jgi:uroporphyrinogen-III decarboxylase